MDIRKFEVFLDLAKTLSYTETAERLFTTQGNISKQILSLEKELDVKLFERSHRMIKLTEAGDIAVIYANKIMSEYETMRQTLLQHADAADFVLNIHAIPSVSNYRGFEMITAFHKAHPEVELHLSEVHGDHVIMSLGNGQSDIVFGRDFGDFGDDYETVVTEEDSFVCILPADHPLAQNEVVNLTDLQNEDFLLLGRETLIYDHVMSLAKKAGFVPHVAYEGQRIDIIMNMVASGMGVSIMMEKSIDLPPNGTIVKRHIDISDASEMSFIRKANVRHTEAAKLFWEFIQK